MHVQNPAAADATLRILVVEDDDNDAMLLSLQLSRSGRKVVCRRVDTPERMREALREDEWDIVISDHVIPGFGSAEALAILRQSGRNLPFIIYSGCISAQLLATAREAGISSCIPKGSVEQLVPAIERELNRRHDRPADSEVAGLVRLAEYDRVTGLPGRALFMRQAGERLTAARDDECIAVCFVDLARFIRVNQAIGYEAADRVLAQIARRLKAVATADSVVSRLAGDKFAIVRGGLRDLPAVRAFAATLVSVLGESCEHEGMHLHLASSMGVSVCPDDGATLAELLLHAETAMFQCKKLLEHNGFLFYFSGMGGDAGARLVLESALWRASVLSELTLLFEPVIALDRGEVAGLDALVRWRHPDFGMLAPERFMQVAEEAGVMAGIGEWTLLEACRQAQHWSGHGSAVPGVAVEVSATQFSQPALLSAVARTLRESQLAPDRLTLVLAESVLINDADAALGQLRALKKLGVRIAIDNFGVGPSSLKLLKMFPVDMLRVDRSFVTGVECDSRDAAIMRAIIGLGSSLGFAVLARGVETAAQLAFLRAHGCGYAQGILFSEPLAASDIAAFASGRAVDNFVSISA